MVDPNEGNATPPKSGLVPEGNRGSAETGIPRGADLRRELVNKTNHTQNLESAVTSLPHIDEQGRSECPFAETLYAQKEEHEAKVTKDVNQMIRYRRALEHEVARCQHNLARIQADSARLNHDKPRAAYSEAAEAAERACRAAIEDRDAVSVALARASAVLEVSRRRKFPGREPQRQQAFPAAGPGAAQGPGARIPSGGLGGELSGLLSIGPLGPAPSK
jgi:chromosome segregation ATPase